MEEEAERVCRFADRNEWPFVPPCSGAVRWREVVGPPPLAFYCDGHREFWFSVGVGQHSFRCVEEREQVQEKMEDVVWLARDHPIAKIPRITRPVRTRGGSTEEGS